MKPETHTNAAYVTKWHDYPHFEMASYRIWVRKVVGTWMQRHEWKRKDGTIRKDEWIHSFRPTPQWTERAAVLPIEDDDE